MSDRSERTMLLAGISAVACIFGTQAVHAQGTARSSPSIEAPADGGVQDIVVTAQRTAQNIQKIPVTVNAVNAERLNTLAVRSTMDLEIAVAGLVLDRKSNAVQPFIRGIGINSGAVGVESPIATYVDGMYLTSPVAATFELADVERVEVLKGPQGTLFGRNATAGAISIVTRDPGSEPALNAEVGYESYQTFSGRFYASMPIDENLAIGVSGYARDQKDGWGTSYSPDGTTRDFRKGWQVAGRGKLVWTSGGGTKVTLGGFYIRDRDNLTVTAATPGLPGKIRTGALAGSTFVNPYFYGTISDYYDDPRYTYYGGNAKISFDLGWATLSNNLTYQNINAVIGLDASASPYPDAVLKTDSTDAATSNELQLQSAPGASFRWLAGFYYLHQALDNHQTNFNTIAPPLTFELFAGTRTDSWAPYLDATINLTSRLSLTGGLRYTHDTRRLVNVTSINAAGVPTSFADRRAIFSKLTYRAAIQYELANDVMAFASVSRGFKSGFFSLGTAAGTALPLKPELVDAKEIGIKSTLFDRMLRFNLSGFHYSYSDIAVTRTVVLPSGLTTTLQENAAKAKIYGIDADFELRPANGLSIIGGITYLPRANYVRFPGAPLVTLDPTGGFTTSFFAAAGKRLLHAPRMSLQGAVSYTADLPAGRLAATLAAQHRSRVYFSADNGLSQAPITLVNATLKYTLPDSRFSTTVWAKNLFDKKYLTEQQASATAIVAAPGTPRTLGITFGVSL